MSGHSVSLNYCGAPAFALVVSGKPRLVLCFTAYRKIVSVNRRLWNYPGASQRSGGIFSKKFRRHADKIGKDWSLM